MSTVSSPELLLQGAIIFLAEKYPFYWKLLYALEPIPVTKLPLPIAVDRFGRIYYTPAIVELSKTEVSLTILFAMNALLRRSAVRRQDRNAVKWFVSVCGEILDDLNTLKVRNSILGFLTIDMGDLEKGKLAEWYYDRIHLELVDGNDVENGKTLIVIDSFGAFFNEKDSQDWGLGSCVDGDRRSYELPPPTEGGPGMTEVEMEIARKVVAEEIAKLPPGNVPGGLLRWAEAWAVVPPNPYEILKYAIGAVAGKQGTPDDVSYEKTRERYGILLPRSIPHDIVMTVIVDTSGSMSEAQLSKALGWIAEITDAFSVSLRVVTGDTTVGWAEEVTSWEHIELVGGGGTDMANLIRQEEEDDCQPKPDLVIVLTDGATPWPDEPPSFPVLVGLIDASDHDEKEVPEWASVFKVESV